MSAALRWQILQLGNAFDERRRARRARRNAADPFMEMDETEFIKTYRLGKEAVHALANDLIPLIPKEKRRAGIPAILKVSGEHVFLLVIVGTLPEERMMTPILNTIKRSPDHYYYTKHVTARNTVERCIGVLKACFRCLLMARQLHYHPIIAGKKVNACTILHNIALASNAPALLLTPEDAQLENNFRQQVQTLNVLLQDDAPVPAATPQSRCVLPDLQEGRQQQHNLVQNLWRERAI